MGIIHDIRRAWAAIPRGRQRQCVMCEGRIGAFLPYRGGNCASAALMRAIGVVGSDVDNFECPRCGAHDRERHLLLYLQESGLLARIPALRILHFAPEKRMAQRIVEREPVEYVKCDLHPSAADTRRVDIEAMPFADGSFDMVIANHVLEHVDDDIRAVAEIRRVLRHDGIAILQTPYSAMLHHTWSDPGLVAEDARLHAYGQEDHVRLFGRDIVERFAAGGLRPCVETHAGLLARYDASVCGVNEAEPFFLFRRID